MLDLDAFCKKLCGTILSARDYSGNLGNREIESKKKATLHQMNRLESRYNNTDLAQNTYIQQY